MAFDKRLLIIGAGGHAKVVIETARAAGWHPQAALDRLGIGHACLGVPVVGTEDQAELLLQQGLQNAVVAIGGNDVRYAFGIRLLSLGFHCPVIAHPQAVISSSAAIGLGVVIMPGGVINAEARIGRFAIINSNATVEHDCFVGEGAHIAPRAAIGGGVRVGDAVLLGIGSVAKPQISIGSGSIIGAGSVVVSDIPKAVKAWGAPARVVSAI